LVLVAAGVGGWVRGFFMVCSGSHGAVCGRRVRGGVDGLDGASGGWGGGLR
jgi:hypothetical protein